MSPNPFRHHRDCVAVAGASLEVDCVGWRGGFSGSEGIPDLLRLGFRHRLRAFARLRFC